MVETNKKQTNQNKRGVLVFCYNTAGMNRILAKKQKLASLLSFIAKWWLNFRGPGGSIYISRYILRNTYKKHNK